jgi:hypothetical protein
MKFVKSTAIVITICALSFLSCSKTKDAISPTPNNYGTVVFWTKNAANFALCRNNIDVFILVPTPFGGGAVTNTAHIRYILSSAPTYCGNEAAVANIVPGTKYYFAPQNCATGQFGAVDSFSLSANQCLKIEIP